MCESTDRQNTKTHTRPGAGHRDPEPDIATRAQTRRERDNSEDVLQNDAWSASDTQPTRALTASAAHT